jgi:hypothetical protein
MQGMFLQNITVKRCPTPVIAGVGCFAVHKGRYLRVDCTTVFPPSKIPKTVLLSAILNAFIEHFLIKFIYNEFHF